MQHGMGQCPLGTAVSLMPMSLRLFGWSFSPAGLSRTHSLPRPSPPPLSPQILYYDGQFDDARYNVALATSAAAVGANVANYVEVVGLMKVRETERSYTVCAACFAPTLTKKSFCYSLPGPPHPLLVCPLSTHVTLFPFLLVTRHRRMRTGRSLGHVCATSRWGE